MLKRIDDLILIQLSDMDSNIYLLGDSAVDSGTGFNFTRLYSIFKAMKKDLESIKQVINTHAHFDHIGGNGYFLEAKTAIHSLGAPVIEKGDMDISCADFFEGKLNPKKVHVKLKDRDKIETGNHSLEVIHTPGHTSCSICLYDKKNKRLFTGDTVFADGVGRTDFVNSDPAALKTSLERLCSLDVKKIFPGHGNPVLNNGGKVLQKILKTLEVNEEFPI